MPEDRWINFKFDDRRRPPGNWRQVGRAQRVSGMRHRRVAAVTFLNGLTYSVERGEDWGIELEREPTNPHDPNAIKVIGRFTQRKKRWFRAPVVTLERNHIGYIDAETAEHLGRFDPDIPIAAEVYEIARLRKFTMKSEGLPLVIKINVLVPGKNEPYWQGQFPEGL
jgi:hypothetical protein